MDRGERRRRKKVKSLRRLKKYWSKYGVNRIYDRHTKKWVNIHSFYDALKIYNDPQTSLFNWFQAVKDGYRLHHSSEWERYERKRITDKENRELKKQMDSEVQDYLNYDPWEWENYCGVCDNFPGDEFHEPSPFIFHECPRKGKITAGTCWRNFDCPYFWD